MSRKHLSGTSELSWRVTPNTDDEAHCAEVTNILKINVNVPKTGRAFVRTNEISKNRVVYVTVIPRDLITRYQHG